MHVISHPAVVVHNDASVHDYVVAKNCTCVDHHSCHNHVSVAHSDRWRDDCTGVYRAHGFHAQCESVVIESLARRWVSYAAYADEEVADTASKQTRKLAQVAKHGNPKDGLAVQIGTIIKQCSHLIPYLGSMGPHLRNLLEFAWMLRHNPEWRHRMASYYTAGAVRLPGRQHTSSVLNTAKHLLYKLSHPLFLRAYYLKYLFSELRKEEYCRRQLGILPFAELDLRAVKRSDILFILASGSSINEISLARWDAIARHDSIGFNFWPIHPFVPGMYLMEAIPKNSPQGMFEPLCRIAHQRAKEYTNVVKVVTELRNAMPGMRFAGSEEWVGPLYALRTIPVAARTESEFAYGLSYLRSKGVFDVVDRINIVFKQASTLSSLIALAIRMQYRTIVLCGVDLNHSEYFYQDKVLYPETASLEFSPHYRPHATNSPMPWRITIEAVILEMKRQFLDPAGIQLYVENCSSALWPRISEAPSSLFTTQAVKAAAP